MLSLTRAHSCIGKMSFRHIYRDIKPFLYFLHTCLYTVAALRPSHSEFQYPNHVYLFLEVFLDVDYFIVERVYHRIEES